MFSNSEITMYREALDDLYPLFSKRYLDTSMLYIPYYYTWKYPSVSKREIEIIALLSAIYDFQMRVGTLRMHFIELIDIISGLGYRIWDLMETGLFKEVINELLRRIGYFHRFDPCGIAIPWIIMAVSQLDLEVIAFRSSNPDQAVAKALWKELSKYTSQMTSVEIRRIRNIVPKPNPNSPLKRINLFLRWVVRDEYPDLGLWKSIDKSILKIPLGLEIARVAGRLFFGRDLRINSIKSLKMVNDILRRINPEDPIRYDFVLSRPALLGICLKNINFSHCWTCPLRDICRIGRSAGKYSELFTNEEYMSLKEPIDRRRLDSARRKHDMILKRVVMYVREALGYIDCRSDYPIDHGLRPDIYCKNSIPLIGEVKTSTSTRQGPMQLKAYFEELRLREGIKEANGLLVYGSYSSDDLVFIREAISIIGLDRLYKDILVLGFTRDFKETKIVYRI